jgi:hypothetical protein
MIWVIYTVIINICDQMHHLTSILHLLDEKKLSNDRNVIF